MKRINHIYDQICSIENLHEAARKAEIGKRKSYGVRLFKQNADALLLQLHESMIQGTFKTSPYFIFKIHTREGKEREIYRLPFYPDRIVHHAIMNILEPVWNSIFIAQTYSCIKKRGIHGAAKQVKSDLINFPSETTYCLKLDVKKFYPSIDHDILKDILQKKIKDQKTLNLLYEIVDSAPGVPIGNYLSQYFANLYLAYFDHYMKEKKSCKFYYRYADDIVILSNDKQNLHFLLADIKQYFEENLKLTVKQNHQVFPVASRGIDFVGYVFYHTHTRLRKRIKQRYARAIKKSQTPETLCAYFGWAKHCDSNHLLKKLTA